MTSPHLSRFLLNFSIISIFFLLSFLPASAAVTQAECTQDKQVIKYPGPYSTSFEGAGADKIDCQYLPEKSSLLKEIIDNSTVKCRRGYLPADFHGVDKNKVNPPGIQDGTGNVQLGDVSTYAAGGKIMTNAADDPETMAKLTPYLKGVEEYQNFSLNYLYSLAYWDGINTYEDFMNVWAAEKGLTINGPSGKHLNPSMAAAAQMQMPLQAILLYQLDVADEIINCNELAGYAMNHHCSTNYLTRKGLDERVLTLAKIVAGKLKRKDPIGTWKKMTKLEKFQTMTLHITKSSPTFVIFVPANAVCYDNQASCAIKQAIASFWSHFTLGKSPTPSYIQAMLPESTNILNGVNEEYNRFNPLKKMDDEDNKQSASQSAAPSTNLYASTAQLNPIYDATPQQKSTLIAAANTSVAPQAYVPPTGDEFLDYLIKKALETDETCAAAPIETTENLGSTATPSKNFDKITWIFQQIANSVPDAGEEMDLYHIYVLSPPDIVAANNRIAADKNSMLRKLMPLKDPYGQTYSGFEEEVWTPQGITGSSYSETVQNANSATIIIDPNCHSSDPKDCKIEKQNYYSYSVNTSNITQPGGWFPIMKKYTNFGAYRPLTSDDNIKDQNKCLLEDFYQPGAIQNGLDLVSTLNASQFSQDSCPNPISSGDKKCIPTQELPIKDGCQLTCDSVNGYTIPPTLKKVIEEAASAFNIPPGLLLGAMYAEGGFEPRCSGSDNNYTDDEIQAMMQCDITSCCNNNTGVFNLISGYAKGTIYKAKIRAGINVDKSNPGSACNIYDSALALADVISRQRGYDSQLWYDIVMGAWDSIPGFQRPFRKENELKDSCGGIPYTDQATYSCTGWTDSQAITAIRLQQGLCGETSKAMDTHRQQMLDVFHQCSN